MYQLPFGGTMSICWSHGCSEISSPKAKWLKDFLPWGWIYKKRGWIYQGVDYEDLKVSCSAGVSFNESIPILKFCVWNQIIIFCVELQDEIYLSIKCLFSVCIESVLPQPEPLHPEHCYIALLSTESLNIFGYNHSQTRGGESEYRYSFSTPGSAISKGQRKIWTEIKYFNTEAETQRSLDLPKKGLFIQVSDVFVMQLLCSSFLEDVKTRIMSVDWKLMSPVIFFIICLWGAKERWCCIGLWKY